jgi:hypothetical protein
MGSRPKSILIPRRFEQFHPSFKRPRTCTFLDYDKPFDANIVSTLAAKIPGLLQSSWPNRNVHGIFHSVEWNQLALFGNMQIHNLCWHRYSAFVLFVKMASWFCSVYAEESSGIVFDKQLHFNMDLNLFWSEHKEPTDYAIARTVVIVENKEICSLAMACFSLHLWFEITFPFGIKR